MKNGKVRVLLVGFGNIGRSIMEILPQYPDIQVVGIVTRRAGEVAKEVKDIKIYDFSNPKSFMKRNADVAIMCGGSKNDLPKQTPLFARYFNVVDSFDTHGHIGPYVEESTGKKAPGHLKKVDSICRKYKHTGHIGIGWDPGSFSLMRALFGATLGENCKVHAFYGLTEKGGLSMGHTNAIKGISGVIDARQYTHAKLEAIEKIRSGQNPELSNREKHWRECKVVANESDMEMIKEKIINMPIYFEPYDTTVKFVSQEELNLEKGDFSHDGLVIAAGSAGCMEFKNLWNSNPTGTAGFLLAYARATYRKNKAKVYGCFSILDTPVADLLLDPKKKIDLI